MTNKIDLPYGTWPSRIKPQKTAGLLEFSELSWMEDGKLLWIERSSNQSSLMTRDPHSGRIAILSGKINVGGGLLYGGGSYTTRRDQIVFIEKKTHQLYLISGENPKPVPIKSSPHPKATPQISPRDNHLIYTESDGSKDSIMMLDFAKDQEATPLHTSFDFYNYLRWHPEGRKITWMSWQHPSMPWINSEIIESSLVKPSLLSADINIFSRAGKSRDVCRLQPEYAPDGGSLAFISDATGWWQIYLRKGPDLKVEQLTRVDADHALPPWLQNQTFYGFSPDSKRIYCIRNQHGFASLWQVDLLSGMEDQISLNDKYTWLDSLTVSPVNDLIATIASGWGTPPEIIITDPAGDQTVIRTSDPAPLEIGFFSQPGAISLEIPGGDFVKGLYYAPHNPAYQTSGKPPLLIIVHSGPTRQKYAEYQPRTQYFTSRGYAVLEVNYRGSTGYGRGYWEALEGQWGMRDVEDVYQSAMSLAKQGLIDKERIALFGSSSGGLTVLQLLVQYPGVFKAAVSLYGVTNLRELIKHPANFERYYHHWLVGDPEKAAERYISRSPLFSAHRIQTPLIIFQGGNDPIVPQEQAEQLVSELINNNVPHEYYLYPDEGHSFKKNENLVDFYLKTTRFLEKYL